MPIRSAEDRDLPAVAAIHKSQFGDHFLGQYSIRLLEKYYGAFLGKSVFLVHETQEGVDGFILGAESDRLSACRATFLRSTLLQCIWETLFRPRLWRKGITSGFSIVIAPRPRRGSSDKAPTKPRLRLLSIAVSKEAMGEKVGAGLIDVFERTIDNGDVCEYGLSLKKTNHRAARFYEKMGFEVEMENEMAICLRKKLLHGTPE